MQETWDDYFIRMAMLVASKSKDRSTKVGVVIVGRDHEVRSTGYNGFPRGVDDAVEHRHERPAKYKWTEHGERNAIYNAARVGIPVRDCTIYLPWGPAPCTDCARAIIQAGITRVVTTDKVFPGKGDWSEDLLVALAMLLEAGVAVDKVPHPTV
jgi:dCMP deaminase